MCIYGAMSSGGKIKLSKPCHFIVIGTGYRGNKVADLVVRFPNDKLMMCPNGQVTGSKH